MKQKCGGYTLAELLVTLGILSIMTAAAVGFGSVMLDSVKRAAFDADTQEVYQIVEGLKYKRVMSTERKIQTTQLTISKTTSRVEAAYMDMEGRHSDVYSYKGKLNFSFSAPALLLIQFHTNGTYSFNGSITMTSPDGYQRDLVMPPPGARIHLTPIKKP